MSEIDAAITELAQARGKEIDPRATRLAMEDVALVRSVLKALFVEHVRVAAVVDYPRRTPRDDGDATAEAPWDLIWNDMLFIHRERSMLDGCSFRWWQVLQEDDLDALGVVAVARALPLLIRKAARGE